MMTLRESLKISFTLVLLSVPGEATAGQKSKTVVAVFMQFENSHSVLALTEMEREAQRILRDSGLHFDWRILQDRNARESHADLVVVTFKGKCQMVGWAPKYSAAVKLAATQISDSDVLAYINVDCDSIRSVLRSVTPASDGGRGEYLLGRALGRVLAHEFYHVFARTKSHGHDGIAKPCFTAAELISERFLFAEGDLKIISQGR